ncbi:SRPBCC family protein [Gordonia sp. CPCC 205515]|uniref:type II toxin-antitoxin system Rv0910 family toxin n=1 Tax=Gordonia sp. CPCC 205515 TaxID=3140791 RepID=UPI003AF37121
MADVDVSIASDLAPQKAWELASDLSRFPEWMTIFGGWRSDLPDQLATGAQVSSLIRVKGFRNIIHWTVTEYDAPQAIALEGHGRGGVRITLRMTVTEIQSGSQFDLHASLDGGLLSGPVGRLVARVIKSDVRQSIDNLAALR